MTRRDRTQPGSLAEHAVTGVRYCGGCNPRYDRTALVGRLAERCPNVRFVRAESGREYDALLVVGGCCACCADISGLAGRRVVRLRRAEDLEEAAEILAALENTRRRGPHLGPPSAC